MNAQDLRLAYLADHPEFIPVLAGWHRREWEHFRPDEPVEAWVGRLKDVCGHREIPTVVVAVREGELVGSAMLLKESMRTRKDLSPWLAGVIVAQQHRRLGIGGLLVDRIVLEAGSLGFETLYLWTPTVEQFYARRGWTTLERTTYRDVEVSVMSRRIEPVTGADAGDGR
jgi:N-acetylglutamate synthase-like GNAT family acetyltransferase